MTIPTVQTSRANSGLLAQSIETLYEAQPPTKIDAETIKVNSKTKLLNLAKNFMTSIASNASVFGSSALRGGAALTVLAGGSIVSMATCCVPPSVLGGVNIKRETWETAQNLWNQRSKKAVPMTSDSWSKQDRAFKSFTTEVEKLNTFLPENPAQLEALLRTPEISQQIKNIEKGVEASSSKKPFDFQQMAEKFRTLGELMAAASSTVDEHAVQVS